MGLEIIDEVTDTLAGDEGVVRVVVIIALELLVMPIDITRHAADLHLT